MSMDIDRLSKSAVFLILFVLPAVGQQRPGRVSGAASILIGAEYKKWLNEDVRWIVTDAERRDFLKLVKDGERDQFVSEFWSRRNPNPASKENAFKQEHYRRIAYANGKFAAGMPGWMTDRGRTYILYGPPYAVDSH